jgi:hypothetical protein
MEYEFELPDFFFNPVFLIICFALWLLQVIAMWRVFEKAGRPGWASLIPIYNIYKLFKIGGKPGWWILLLLVPFANIVVIIWGFNMVSKSFGHDEGFTAGLIFLGLIFWPILGFGQSKYLGPYGDPAAFAAYQQQDRFDFEHRNQ